jgi:predicted Holliday junction resolvase-like endonuclease
MTGYIIAGLIIFLLILIIVLYFTALVCRQLQSENTEIKTEIVKQKATIAELLKHAKEVAHISQDKGKVQEKIENAKTDEELVNIANAIISTNNERLRK